MAAECGWPWGAGPRPCPWRPSASSARRRSARHRPPRPASHRSARRSGEGRREWLRCGLRLRHHQPVDFNLMPDRLERLADRAAEAHLRSFGSIDNSIQKTHHEHQSGYHQGWPSVTSPLLPQWTPKSMKHPKVEHVGNFLSSLHPNLPERHPGSAEGLRSVREAELEVGLQLAALQPRSLSRRSTPPRTGTPRWPSPSATPPAPPSPGSSGRGRGGGGDHAVSRWLTHFQSCLFQPSKPISSDSLQELEEPSDLGFELIGIPMLLEPGTADGGGPIPSLQPSVFARIPRLNEYLDAQVRYLVVGGGQVTELLCSIQLERSFYTTV